MIEAAPSPETETEAADFFRLRELLERGDVDAARIFITEMEQRWPESSRVRHFVQVLEPPKARVLTGQKGQSRHREHEWLRAHAREYPGCWLALDGDGLIAADPDLAVVFEAIDRSPDGREPLLYLQPGP